MFGAGLLTYAGVTYASGAIARDRARSAWDAAEARAAIVAVEARLAAAVPTLIVPPGAPVARLVLPRLGLDEIVVEGIGDAELNAGPGHLPGSVLPGERGNAVISAHRDRHFHALDRVSVGDTVVTETLRERVVWRIAERKVVARGVPALWETSGPTLTLTTCWPVRYFGSAPDRLLLTAVPLARTRRA